MKLTTLDDLIGTLKEVRKQLGNRKVALGDTKGNYIQTHLVFVVDPDYPDKLILSYEMNEDESDSFFDED